MSVNRTLWVPFLALAMTLTPRGVVGQVTRPPGLPDLDLSPATLDSIRADWKGAPVGWFRVPLNLQRLHAEVLRISLYCRAGPDGQIAGGILLIDAPESGDLSGAVDVPFYLNGAHDASEMLGAPYRCSLTFLGEGVGRAPWACPAEVNPMIPPCGARGDRPATTLWGSDRHSQVVGVQGTLPGGI